MFDPHKIRLDFPIFKHNKTVFLDNAATTYKPQVVIDAVTKYLSMETANSHRGDYDNAFHVDEIVDETRELVRNFINAKQVAEVIFTSGTTMGLNLVAFSYGLENISKDDEILLSVAEHASNTLPWFEVARQTGAVVKFIPLDKHGRITVDNVAKMMNDKTRVVAITHVSNVLGFVNDIKAIAKVVHEHNAVIVVDGAQSLPHLLVDVADLNIDFLAFSGHKMLAPTGIGVLYGKKELLKKMNPFQFGGGMNLSYDLEGKVEYYDTPLKFEAGTLNLEAIYGFNAALKYLLKLGITNISDHEHNLRKYAIRELKKISHVIIHNEDAETGIITFNIKNVFAQDAATYYNSQSIAVRSGQHCAKNLKDFLGAPATIRASFYIYTTLEDVDKFIAATKTAEDYLDAYF